VKTRRFKTIVSIVGIAAGLTFSSACFHSKPAITKGYYAVLLDNSQVYFGKIADLGSDYPVLTEVFYIQSTINQESKQQNNILLKRGKEWHAPDKMILNARHIVMVEPVTPGSTVANLILKANGGG